MNKDHPESLKGYILPLTRSLNYDTKVALSIVWPIDLPFLSRYEKEHYMGAYALFDCTWPREWPKEDIPVKASFETLWPKEVQDRVLKNWTDYGYV